MAEQDRGEKRRKNSVTGSLSKGGTPPSDSLVLSLSGGEHMMMLGLSITSKFSHLSWLCVCREIKCLSDGHHL